MLNRSVAIIRYLQPFVDWIHAADPNPSEKMKLSEANEDNTAYLVEVEDEDEFEDWLDKNWERVFKIELEAWYTDSAMWPKNRTKKVFKSWCRFELHTIVLDLGKTELVDDEVSG